MNRVKQALYRICPHWYWPVPDYGHHIMMDVTKRERCRICGKHRIHARISEPHPTRDKNEILNDLQQPGYELVVEEWLPYGSKGP